MVCRSGGCELLELDNEVGLLVYVLNPASERRMQFIWAGQNV